MGCPCSSRVLTSSTPGGWPWSMRTLPSGVPSSFCCSATDLLNTSITRTPGAGAGWTSIGCETSASVSTTARASYEPTGTPVKVARPSASVFSMRGASLASAPPCSDTSCTSVPTIRLVSSPRIRRTVMVPVATAGSCRGIPDICDGSGIAGCAAAIPIPRPPGLKTGNTRALKRASDIPASVTSLPGRRSCSGPA